jgi:hypothetical protein
MKDLPPDESDHDPEEIEQFLLRGCLKSPGSHQASE